MASLDSAFLAPAIAPSAVAPQHVPVGPALMLSGTLATSLAPTTAALATAGKVGAMAAVTAGSLVVRGTQRRRRVQRLAAGAAVPSEGDAQSPPFQPSKQLGAMEPLGFFDPLGFTAVGDEAGFRNLRASELKHGRVAMMASVGLLGQHFLKFPGFEKVPAGLAVMGTGQGIMGFTGIFILSAFLELLWREDQSREPGNFGDPFGIKMYDEDMRSKEINNGRFAMICVLGIFAAELATGKDAIQQFGF